MMEELRVGMYVCFVNKRINEFRYMQVTEDKYGGVALSGVKNSKLCIFISHNHVPEHEDEYVILSNEEVMELRLAGVL